MWLLLCKILAILALFLYTGLVACEIFSLLFLHFMRLVPGESYAICALQNPFAVFLLHIICTLRNHVPTANTLHMNFAEFVFFDIILHVSYI